jgi:antirestriction protein ArdC
MATRHNLCPLCRYRHNGHWTGAEKRPDRKLNTGRFGDEAYAQEELIAELTAAFTCAHLGLDNEPRDDHAQYLASWLKVLKRDNRAVFTAASAAQKATDYLISLQLTQEAQEPIEMRLAA